MKLELKHLAPYLPYGLKLHFIFNKEKIFSISAYDECINGKHTILIAQALNGYYKPILRPISDITKEIEVNGEKFIPLEYNAFKHSKEDIIEFQNNFIHYKAMKYGILKRLFEWHFDVFGLIDKGLAIDINSLPQS